VSKGPKFNALKIGGEQKKRKKRKCEIPTSAGRGETKEGRGKDKSLIYTLEKPERRPSPATVRGENIKDNVRQRHEN